jgi:hypothetical protein
VTEEKDYTQTQYDFETRTTFTILPIVCAAWAAAAFGETPAAQQWTGPYLNAMTQRLIKAGYEPMMLMMVRDPNVKAVLDRLKTENNGQFVWFDAVKELVMFILGGFHGGEGLVHHRIQMNEQSRMYAVRGGNDMEALMRVASAAGHGKVMNLSDILSSNPGDLSSSTKQ